MKINLPLVSLQSESGNMTILTKVYVFHCMVVMPEKNFNLKKISGEFLPICNQYLPHYISSPSDNI